MTLKLYERQGRYTFAVGDNSEFCSWRDFYLVLGIRSGYEHMWMAHRDASTLLNQKRYHVDAMSRYSSEDLSKPVAIDMSGEQMLVNHYLDILELIGERAKEAKGDEEQNDMVYAMMKDIKLEIEAVIEKLTDNKDKRNFQAIQKSLRKTMRKYFGKRMAQDEKEEAKQQAEQAAMPEIPAQPIAPPVADPNFGASPLTASLLEAPIAEGLRKDILSHYAEKACVAIQGIHKRFIYETRPSSMSIMISTIDGRKRNPILKIRLNNHLMVTDVVPLGDIAQMYPYHTGYFYQRYWKPIVECIGHVYLDDFPMFVRCHEGVLPDLPAAGDFSGVIDGWNINKGRKEQASFMFRGKKPIWIFGKMCQTKEASTSKYIEQDYFNAIVRCIDPQLKTLYGKTGEVIQVMPLADHIEIDINFGRQVVRLSELQIEIISEKNRLP